MRGIWRTLAAAAAVAGALAVVSPAQAATPRQLLAQYQPVTLMDEQEPFRPTDVNGFVSDSVLEQQTAPGVWTLVNGNPALGSLPVGGTVSYRLNQQPCSPTDGIVGDVSCYGSSWSGTYPKNVVYGRVAYRPGRIVLQYWYFYYDDVYSYDYPPDDRLWQAHEGDWEVVTVVLRRSDQRPQYAAYSQHCTGERRAWGDVEKRGTHPVDHVAVGSHANLFDQGSHPIATQCIPQQALAILQGFGLPLPVDRSGAGGEALGPALPGLRHTAIRRIDRRRTPWVSFAGYWGEDEVFHGPAPIGTVTAGPAPLSPGLHAVWLKPISVTLHWPLG